MITQRKRIHDFLVKTFRTGEFFCASFEGDTMVIDTTKPLAPRSVVADEQTGSWEDSPYGKKVARDRAAWLWEVVVTFTKPVDASLFEASITEKVPFLPSVPASQTQRLALRSVKISLDSATYQHPPRKNPENGTTITYTFEAEETHR